MTIERFDIDHVPCTLFAPSVRADIPVCLFLFGGGGSAENLVEMAPLLRRLPEMVVACAGVPPHCFYLGEHERVVSSALVDALRERGANGPVGLLGISMGGFGALKIAFAEPERFGAVAAIAPMIEPGLKDVPLRNRFGYPRELPSELLGPDRDPAVMAREHPAARLERQQDLLRRVDLPIYLDAGSRDALNAHDGAEYLHRRLWALDIRHEYHLLRDADHVGPSMPGRLTSAFKWVHDRLVDRSPQPGAAERGLRGMLEPARRDAEALDPTMSRTYGVLDDSG